MTLCSLFPICLCDHSSSFDFGRQIPYFDPLVLYFDGDGGWQHMYQETIDLSHVPPEGLKLERRIHPNAWAIQEPEWQSQGDLVFDLFVSGGPQKVVVRGKLAAGILATCHRCLKQTKLDLDRNFHLTYLPPDRERFAKEEVELSPSELEVAYLEAAFLPIHEMVREQIYLAVPMKVLCRPDCRGLCFRCGVDLKEVECGCLVEQEDPRWASLRKIVRDSK